MALKKFKPTTSSRRFMTVSSFEEITTNKPYKPLLRPIKKSGGRNNKGRISVRRRGGGHKRMYRIIDFKRDKRGVPAAVSTIEYDPNRSARIALLTYADGEKRYMLAPVGLKVGMKVQSGPDAEVAVGNMLPLAKIPPGTIVHNVEMVAGRGGQIARSAGTGVQVVGKEGKYAQLKMPSGEVRMVRLECSATVGQVGNVEHGGISLGKAGRSRWLGRRPKVRGVVMNPVDHPHGGGEGKSSGGRHPVTPWGVPTKGHKTRDKKKRSNKYIMKKRK